jgi:predicted site-specific integrase-resolvase
MNEPTPMTADDHDLELLRTKRVAVELRVSERTLERWRSQGEGPPFVAMGGGIFYRRADLAEYLKLRKAHGRA